MFLPKWCGAGVRCCWPDIGYGKLFPPLRFAALGSQLPGNGQVLWFLERSCEGALGQVSVALGVDTAAPGPCMGIMASMQWQVGRHLIQRAGLCNAHRPGSGSMFCAAGLKDGKGNYHDAAGIAQ